MVPLKYVIAGILGLIVVVGAVWYFFLKSKNTGGSDGPHPPPPDPNPPKPEVFAIATWDNAIGKYSRSWAVDYNTARSRAITTVNLPLASYDQITDAWKAGFCVCAWGWIQSNPNIDIVLPSYGTGGPDCGATGLIVGKVTPPATNVGCIFVYGPKPKLNIDANDPRNPLYRGYMILPFEFGKAKNRWSQWDV